LEKVALDVGGNAVGGNGLGSRKIVKVGEGEAGNLNDREERGSAGKVVNKKKPR
jgi:hypothetical protein